MPTSHIRINCGLGSVIIIVLGLVGCMYLYTHRTPATDDTPQNVTQSPVISTTQPPPMTIVTSTLEPTSIMVETAPTTVPTITRAANTDPLHITTTATTTLPTTMGQQQQVSSTMDATTTRPDMSMGAISDEYPPVDSITTTMPTTQVY